MSNTYSLIEQKRLELQADLDSQKTALERNKLGQFATPTLLANEIISFGLTLLPPAEAIRFIDPAIGTGAFYSALLENSCNREIEQAVGYEIDPHYGIPSSELWNTHQIKIILEDFTKQTKHKIGFNFLICNPPYVRHHHIEQIDKQRLNEQSERIAGVKLSGLAGLYCHFIAHCHEWMSVNGIAGWLIPSEFMDVNYGSEVKKYLLEKVTLIRIHRFDPKDCQFEDALVSSAVVWFKNSKPAQGHSVEFTYGGTLLSPKKTKKIIVDELRSEPKWTRYPLQGIREESCGAVLSDLFDVKRGIATGDNDFFILSREKIEELDLPFECFTPILPSPRHLTMDEIDADESGCPILSKELFVLTCKLPEETVQAKYPQLWKYLESGKDKVSSRFLCKSRKVWYWQEERQATPFICTYMGRESTKNKKPFRFVLNHSSAIVSNSYLMLFPKSLLSNSIRANKKLERLVWAGLNQIDVQSLVNEGRVYGGGLHKLEPKEMANLPVEHIASLLNYRGSRSIQTTFL